VPRANHYAPDRPCVDRILVARQRGAVSNQAPTVRRTGDRTTNDPEGITAMRTLVNSTYVTLDGVIQDPQDWPSLGSFSDDGNRVQVDLIERCDAVLMGRHTYDAFAPVWTSRSGDPYSDRINAMAKYVVSTTLTDPEWHNTTVIDHDPVQAVRELKQQPGADIVQYGFGPISHALMAEGLIDELRLWVHPFFVGSGTADDALYRSGSTGRFEIADTTVLGSGVVILTYRKAQ
jgi:dihydrofolate reductase